MAASTDGTSAAVRDALRVLAAELPSDAVLPVPVRIVLALLKNDETDRCEEREGGDLSIRELAVEFQRATSTVRGWLARGDIDDAYQLQGRAWRIPRASVQRFREKQQAASRRDTGRAKHRTTQASIGQWRKLGGG
jgi:hypothetical protein